MRSAISLPNRLLAAIASFAIVAGIAALQAAAVDAATGQVLYGSDGAGGNKGGLLVLDPETGAVLDTIGPIGYAITGLAIHPSTGVLYGVTGNSDADAPGSLITIDKATGAGTLVGGLGGGQAAADITFGADGTLFGWLEPSSDDLATIDLTTGAATIVGESGLSTFGSALAGNGNPLTFAGEGDSGCLHQIDMTTGAASCPVSLDGSTDVAISAASYDSAGRLFAVRLVNQGAGGTSELITIDPSTGAITVVGASVNGLDAIAFGVAQPLTAAKVAHVATSLPGGTNGYTITINNPNGAEATIESITDILPAGFGYVAGSTTGATTTDPSVTGSTLAWSGPFEASAGGNVALSFDVTVSTVSGTYQNQAGGTAEGNTITGTGPTAGIVVAASASPSPSPSPPVRQLPNTGSSPNATVGPIALGLASMLVLLAIIAVVRRRLVRV